MSDITFSKFNLIPPKSKEEIVSIEERDNSILYSVFLIFFAVIIYTVLTLGKTFFIDTREVFLKDSIAAQEDRIASFNSVKAINGELFIKSSTLAPIVQQDIKLTELIRVANELVVNSPGSIVTNYSRESDGTFSVTFQMGDYSDINQISQSAENIDNLTNFFIENISQQNRTSPANAKVSFNLTLTEETLD